MQSQRLSSLHNKEKKDTAHVRIATLSDNLTPVKFVMATAHKLMARKNHSEPTILRLWLRNSAVAGAL